MSSTICHYSPSNTIPFPYNTIKIPKPFLSFKQSPKAHLATPSQPPNATTNDNINNPTTNTVECTNRNSSLSSNPLSNSTPTIKAPTPPWMKGPLIVEPNQIINLSKRKPKKDSSVEGNDAPVKVLSDKVSGGRGKKAMKMIFQGIEKLHERTNPEEIKETPENVEFIFSPGELWGEESSKLEMENRKVEIPNSLEKFGMDFSIKKIGKVSDFKTSKKMPWEKIEKPLVFKRLRKEKVMSAAELNYDTVLLERLKSEAEKMRIWVKVMKAGVTEAVVHQVHSIWNNNELAMLKFDLPLSRNMDRAQEIVEIKTRGFVIWRKKDTLVIFRGNNYEFLDDQESSSVNITDHNCEEESISISGSLYERESDRLLDGLGPRFIDWWWKKPLPVDADLLPEVVPGFKTMSRLCPPGVRSNLTDNELTYFRMLARPLPTHFVLGRNRKLQGLALAILKLWEKCHIAKIALKWGIPNTDNEQMAYELKILTGGVLLLRNKFYIILYRGNDFLPSQVSNLVSNRETELNICQIQEESARLKANEILTFNKKPLHSIIGTLSEFKSIQSVCSVPNNIINETELKLKAKKERVEKELRREQHKLILLKKKISKSAKKLEDLNSSWKVTEQVSDHELITVEERECLRKIGLKMDRSLILGRRGIFDGIIEGIFQHWKYREVVKVITMQRRFSQVIDTANLLEIESDGIVISIDKLKEGHAIIMYRGKNYSRPKVVQNNLLNKRDALERSLEMQRIGSLKFFANQTEVEIFNLKSKLKENN